MPAFWRPSVRSGARSRTPARSKMGQMETFGQVGCSVGRLPIHFMVGTGGTIRSGTGGWVGFHPLFRGGRCNRGVVPLPIRFTARKDGDLRSDRVLGEDAGTIIFVSVRAQPHDQDGGDLRSGRVLGQETTHPFHGGHRRHDQKRGKMETFGQVGCSVRRLPIHFMAGTGGTIIFVSRPGKMETFGQVGCSTEADGDLRSGRVLGQETTHPFHGGHRRHDHICFGTGTAARSEV